MSSPQTQRELPAAQKIIQFLAGKCLAQAVSVAAELGITDLLTDAPTGVEELAATTSTHAPSLYRLLRALTNQHIRRGRRPPLHLDAPCQVPAQRCAGFDAKPGSLDGLTPGLARPGRTAALGQDRRNRHTTGVWIDRPVRLLLRPSRTASGLSRLHDRHIAAQYSGHR